MLTCQIIIIFFFADDFSQPVFSRMVDCVVRDLNKYGVCAIDNFLSKYLKLRCLFENLLVLTYLATAL